MSLEEIKELFLAKKKYLLILLVIGALFFMLRKNDEETVDNSHMIGTNSTQIKSEKQRQTNSGSDSLKTENVEASKTVTVDISGAVKKQGVYTLHNGARIEELIQAAGGLKSNAQLKSINRAIMLKDQDKIYIPYRGEKVDNAVSNAADPTTSSSGNVAASNESNGEKVNLNTATVADLQKLNGIGEKKAEQIIAYREQKGQFKKIEDLMQVSGIGEKTFAALKDQLAL